MSQSPDQTTDSDERRRGRHWGWRSSLSIASISVALLCLVFLWLSPTDRPTASAMLFDFGSMRANLDRLAAMMREDTQVESIQRLSFDYVQDQPRLDQNRIREYRRIMRACGLKRVSRDYQAGALWLTTWGSSVGLRGGYLVGRVSPMFTVLDSPEQLDASNSMGFYVLPIEGDWYLFYWHPG